MRPAGCAPCRARNLARCRRYRWQRTLLSPMALAAVCRRRLLRLPVRSTAAAALRAVVIAVGDRGQRA
eukprot:6422288-Prymnesium_polylepis.1